MGTNLVAVLAWWPGLAMLWWAAVPCCGIATVAGIGVGLAVLGLVDTLTQSWGQRRHAANRHPRSPTPANL
ncbi:MAG TPA: hypothetical protein VGH89_09805, partial [Pseudonocardia sp.]